MVNGKGKENGEGRENHNQIYTTIERVVDAKGGMGMRGGELERKEKENGKGEKNQDQVFTLFERIEGTKEKGNGMKNHSQ